MQQQCSACVCSSGVLCGLARGIHRAAVNTHLNPRGRSTRVPDTESCRSSIRASFRSTDSVAARRGAPETAPHPHQVCNRVAPALGHRFVALGRAPPPALAGRRRRARVCANRKVTLVVEDVHQHPPPPAPRRCIVAGVVLVDVLMVAVTLRYELAIISVGPYGLSVLCHYISRRTSRPEVRRVVRRTSRMACLAVSVRSVLVRLRGKCECSSGIDAYRPSVDLG